MSRITAPYLIIWNIFGHNGSGSDNSIPAYGHTIANNCICSYESIILYFNSANFPIYPISFSI